MTPNILVFDNYDSFTYNLVHLVEKILHGKVTVYRNDEIPLEKVKAFDKIILSPGPGIPEEAGMLLPLIKEYASTKSILGVCLGHQAIGQSFGGTLVNLSTVFHGVATPIRIVKRETANVETEPAKLATANDLTAHASRFTMHATRLTPHVSRKDLFDSLPDVIEVGRYHSWVVAKEGFPAELEITAVDDNGFIMGLQHKKYDVRGVQFHPESILTPQGETIMRNWLGD
jgi:anthranilate synthase component 2